MKPSKLLNVGILCFLVGFIWTCTFLFGIKWYVANVQSNILMAAFILIALLMLFGGLVIILSKLE